MSDVVMECRRALERMTIPAIGIMRYDHEVMGRSIKVQDDVRMTPLERHTNATAILRRALRLPGYEQSAVLGLAGDYAMKEGAVCVLLDLVDRDYLGDGPAKEAIRYWIGAESMSIRNLVREYGASAGTHHNYRHKVAGILDALLIRATVLVYA